MWVSADPGCGKSVLSRFLVEEELCSVKSQESLPATVCFFFFKDDNDEQKSASAALCALLHQILSQRKSLVRHAMPAFEANGKKLREMFHTLWNILIAVAADPACGNVVCIIDALDECEEVSRHPFLESLVRFFSKSTDTEEKSFLKTIVTSRPYPAIERKLDPLQKVHFGKFRLKAEDETDDITNDIERVVRARVKTIGSMKTIAGATLADLEERLIKNADRTFLWVTLILDIIENSDESSVSDINQTISTLPSEVDAVYNNILRHSRDEGKARKILHIVVAAARPFSLKEMNVAYAIASRGSSGSQNGLQPSIESTVRGICGLFVKVVNKRFYLVHQTAKEFLAKPSNCSASSLGRWKYSLDPAESNLVLAKICISYLLFDIFESHPLVIDPNVERADLKKAVDQYTNGHDFLDYAANHWAVHFRGAKTEETAMLESILEVCDTRSARFLTWFQVHWITIHSSSRCPQGFTELMVGSYFGHETVVRLLLDKGAAVDAKDDLAGRTPLSWAAARGHEAVARLLLDKGAAVDVKDDLAGRTPLSWAAEGGHEAVVRLLLDKGAAVDGKDTKYGRTPLSLATERGHEAVVRLLLDKGAAVDAKDDMAGQTPLSRAAERGHEAVARLLLDRGAAVDAEDTHGRTPLSWAAEGGHEAVARLLLDKGAAVDAKDTHGRTPLSWAAEDGPEAVVRLLLDKGAAVDAKDDMSGRTPLSWAAEDGPEAVVRLLLDRGAAVDAKDTKYGRTPLSRAAALGNRAVVRLLLDEGAAVDGKDTKYGRTPLWWAAARRCEAVVRLLLDKGAAVDVKETKYGLTPLSLAAARGYEAMVRLLLAAVDGEDTQDGRTPLSLAAERGHEVVVWLLLDKGAAVDAKDTRDGRTPLSWAAEGGHEAVVRLLLDKGATVDTKDDLAGRTPVSWAAEGGHEVVVRLLQPAAIKNISSQHPQPPHHAP